jgi:RNA polymerase sigma-70 factor (ECF subfamily)
MEDFAALYDRHHPRVFAYVYGRVWDMDLASDIVSDVFERASIKRHSLRDQDTFASWLFTIARNVVVSYQRKSKTTSPQLQVRLPEEALRSPEQAIFDDRSKTIIALLRQLPRREQEILSLKFDAELTNRQIADVLHLSEANVRVTLFRTLRRLREKIRSDLAEGTTPTKFSSLEGIWRGKTDFSYREIRAMRYRPKQLR